MGYIKDRWKEPGRAGNTRRWQVKYRVDGKERSGGTYSNERVAKRRLVQLEADLLRGTWVDPTDTTTVTERCYYWAASRPHNARTALRINSLIKVHIENTKLGPRRLAAVRPSEVQAWATDRAKYLSPSTLRVLVSLLSSVYSAAVLDRLVGHSPVASIRLPADSSPRLVPLTVDEVRRLTDAMEPRFRAAVVTQAGLGLRLGECLALQRPNIDFLRRTVRIEHQVAPRTLELIAPKTPQSRRTLPLPTVVSEALARQLELKPAGVHGLLWYTSTGRPINHDFYREKFTAAVKSTKLPKSTSPHSLRHHYASVLLAAGESVVAVAERLGHENAKLVISTYGHLLPDSEDRTRKAIDEAWNPKPEDESPASQGRPQ